MNSLSNVTYNDVNTALLRQKTRMEKQVEKAFLVASVVAMVGLTILFAACFPKVTAIVLCVAAAAVLSMSSGFAINSEMSRFRASIDNIVKTSLNSYKTGKFDNQEDHKKLFALADKQTLIDLYQLPIERPVGPPPAYTGPETEFQFI